MLTLSDLNDAESLCAALVRELSGVVITRDGGDSYLYYDPDGVTDPANRFAFATIMTTDAYDGASALGRDEHTYRVNLGIGRGPYEDLFGRAPREAAGHRVIDTGHDYTRTDSVLPHPFYAPLHWVCIVNPGEATLEDLRRLTTTAHALARRQYKGAWPRSEHDGGETGHRAADNG
jgi:hypothetical protein